MDSTIHCAVMSYRDDRDADRARIEALESELAAARTRIDELEGKRAQALVLASGGALAPGGKATTPGARWLGAPTRLELDHEFAGEFPVDKFEDLVDEIRTITRDRGRTELLRSSVAWWASTSERGVGPFTCVTVTVKSGRTKLAVTDNLGQLAAAIHVGIGVGAGSVLAVGGAGAAIALASPLVVPVLAVGVIGAMFGGTRALYRRGANKRAENLQRLFDGVRAEIERTLRASGT